MSEDQSNQQSDNQSQTTESGLPPHQEHGIPQTNAASQSTEQNPFSVPHAQTSVETHPHGEGDATGGLIPYKNPMALVGYYMGYLGLLPLIGIPFAIAAIILGFIGLKRKKANPVIRGSGHAIFAIVAGFVGLLCGGGILTSIIIGIATGG